MISTQLQIRFADCDLAEHIHNAIYLHYFETGRMNFFVSELGDSWDWKENGIILKKNIITYHSPGNLTDSLSIDVNCTDIGKTSFVLSYEVISHNKKLIAEGTSVIVCFNYSQNKPISIPSQLMDILKKHFIPSNKA